MSSTSGEPTPAADTTTEPNGPTTVVPPAGPYEETRTTSYKFSGFDFSITTETKSTHVPVVVVGGDCGCGGKKAKAGNDDAKWDALLSVLQQYTAQIISAVHGQRGAASDEAPGA